MNKNTAARLAMMAAGILILTSCSTATVATLPPAPSSSPVVPSTAEYTLVQYPEAGFSGLYAQTAAAKMSIDIEMYELGDHTEEAALVAAKKRGVEVYVLLDSAYSGRAVNTDAYNYLSKNGVPVRWAPSDRIVHIKTTVFDQTVADISTANLTSRYYTTTRDAEIIDRNPQQVNSIVSTFAQDWANMDIASDSVSAPGLVWSPDNAESNLVDQITSAKTSIDFTSEELSDPEIYQALAGDARRGVTCRVVMNASTDWDTAFTTITAAGCQVHVLPKTATGLYMHEKLVLSDAATPTASMMLGSQNSGYTSLVLNRELSIVVTAAQAPSVVSAAAATFNADFLAAQAWEGH